MVLGLPTMEMAADRTVLRPGVVHYCIDIRDICPSGDIHVPTTATTGEICPHGLGH